MLTPNFELSQTDDEVTLIIKAPLANVAKAEVTVDNDIIIFYCSPYYLRIHLPGQVTSNENDSGKYDCDNQEFSFAFPKVTKNEYFPDLDLIGTLLIPKKKHTIKPVIEDISPSEVVPSSDPESDDNESWYINQEIVNNCDPIAVKYGFANKTQGLRNHLSCEFNEILDFVDFENTNANERSLLREADEQTKFSEDHYLADLMEVRDEVDSYIYWKSPLSDKLEQQIKVKLTKEESELLKTLGNKDYLLDNCEKKMALFSLVDILFAYAYNHRTTFGEDTVESAWTINKLSATLSWLQSFQTLKEVKIACVRRSLVFPLYRRWNLSMEVIKDTVNILKLGRRQILKCLLEIHKMFNASEPRYLLNELYIVDYCIWIQKVSDKKIETLCHLFDEIEISKDDIGLELEELEAAALMIQDETDLEIVRRLKGMQLYEIEDEESSEFSSRDSNTSLDSDDLTSPEVEQKKLTTL